MADNGRGYLLRAGEGIGDDDRDVEGPAARVLIIATPGGLDRFLDQFHAAGDWQARDAVAERHGLVVPR